MRDVVGQGGHGGLLQQAVSPSETADLPAQGLHCCCTLRTVPSASCIRKPSSKRAAVTVAAVKDSRVGLWQSIKVADEAMSAWGEEE